MGVLLKDEQLIDDALNQYYWHIKYLQDPESGLYYHGYNNITGDHMSGIKWGRANAWAAYTMSQVGICLPQCYLYPKFLDVVGSLNDQLAALKLYQTENGLWRTIVDDAASYEEVSASAGIAAAMITKGNPLHIKYINKAIPGMLANVSPDGRVLNVSGGTAVMKDAGYAHMGLGAASGPNKAEEAARMAIASPLLETSINGARGVIVNFLVPPDVDLEDITNASQMIHDAAHPDVNLIWGVAFDEKLEDEIKIVVIATNFDHESGFRIPTPPVDTEVPEDKITEVEPQTEQEPINDDLDISALIDMLNHDRDKRS